MMKNITIPFRITTGKFKEIRGFQNEVEDIENCDICKDEDLCHKKCFYLYNDKVDISLQICEECFKKLKMKDNTNVR